MGRIYNALHKSGVALPEFLQPESPRTDFRRSAGAQEACVESPVPCEDSRGVWQAEAPAEGDPKAPGLQDIPVEHVGIRPDKRIAIYSAPHSPGADRFRYLRLRLRELAVTRKLKTVILTSSRPSEGKSTVSLNVATALAEGGKRAVLVIDGDFYRPALLHMLGLKPGPGFADCLRDGLTPLTSIRRVEPLGFYFLPAGEPGSDAAELMQSDSLSGLLQQLRSFFEWVVIDTPPIVPLADTLCLSRHADASLLVVKAGSTPREEIEDALELLGPTVLGIVLNGAGHLDRLYHKYYGYYHIKDDVTIA